MTAPKAFICHSGKDQERFIEDFARKLHADNGIETFYAGWDLQPGDRLSEKILGTVDGKGAISEAQFFIIVISENSAGSDWIRKELSQALVQEIEGRATIIPVVLDAGDEVPDVVRDLFWVEVDDTDSYDEQLTDIVKRIHGISDKPELGSPPGFVTAERVDFGGNLEDEDDLVLTTVCSYIFESGNTILKTHLTKEIRAELNEHGLSDDMIAESIQILGEKFYVKADWHSGATPIRRLGLVEVMLRTFETFLRAATDVDVDSKYLRIASMIENEGYSDMSALIADSGINVSVVKFVLEVFEQKQFVSLARHFNGAKILKKPQLKRFLRKHGRSGNT